MMIGIDSQQRCSNEHSSFRVRLIHAALQLGLVIL
jgi:hypothetical protein